MKFVLVFPLILSILSRQQSHAAVTVESDGPCQKCPAGSYLYNNTCKQCPNNTYTAIPNCISACIRCQSCNHREIVLKPCSINSKVVCGCQNGYYYSNDSNECKKCTCKNCIKADSNSDYIKKCQPCQNKECLKVPGCRKICNASITTPVPGNPSTTTSTTTTTKKTTATSAGTSTSNRIYNPAVDPITTNSESQMRWLLVMVVGISLVLLFLLLLFFTNNLFRCLKSGPSWSEGKDLEMPKYIYSEQRSHRDSSPTTPAFNISEETPMMAVRQSPPILEHSAPISPQPPDEEHTVARQDEPPARWPAIVLYTIIKEVPLRRWKEFLRLLSVADQQMERVELETGLGLGSMEMQYQMLKLWSQSSAASLSEVFSALHHMNLSGCAQLLQENLDKLPWRPDPKQDSTACKSQPDCV